jgi:hypothetical protein
MKGQKKIIGQKIVSMIECDEYIVATLGNGMEIEIGGITSAAEAKRINKQVEDLIAKEKQGKLKRT